MSLVNRSLWESMLPGMPMPEGATFEQYLVAQEAIMQEESKAWHAAYLKELVAMKRKVEKEISDFESFKKNTGGDDRTDGRLERLYARLEVEKEMIRMEVELMRDIF